MVGLVMISLHLGKRFCTCPGIAKQFMARVRQRSWDEIKYLCSPTVHKSQMHTESTSKRLIFRQAVTEDVLVTKLLLLLRLCEIPVPPTNIHL